MNGKFLTKNKRYQRIGYICLMNAIRAIFGFYLRSSIHVAMAVISLIFVTGKFLNITPGFDFMIFVCCSTIATYNFIKYGVEARKYLLVSNRYHRAIQLFSFVNLLIALFYIRHLYTTSLIVLIVTALFIGVYAIPIYPGAKNLRNYGMLKVFLVALVWTFITALLPVAEYRVELSWDTGVLVAQRFILILVLMVPFEIRDLKHDPPELRTIPQRIGVKATRRAGFFLALVYFLMTLLKDDLHPLELLGNASLLIFLVLALGMARTEQSKYFASFWVEGVPILWGGIIWVLDMYWAYP